MADTQYAPLTAALVRTLSDKLYEKRKAAALDIEKQVRELVLANQMPQLSQLCDVLRDLTLSANSNAKKGGLIGLAAAAIASGKNVPEYSSQLIEPVLSCFNDPDPRVRYYACESLYNIVKICRSASLNHFNELFDTLWRLSADTDLNVRSGAELLDSLLKDIVLGTPSFKTSTLMFLIRERIYAQNSANRKFIVSWLSALLTYPKITISTYLPEVLDGLFQMLGDGQSGVRDATEMVLGQLLGKLDDEHKVNNKMSLASLVNVLIVHAANDGSLLTQRTALLWLNQLLDMQGSKLLKYLSSYLTAVLPCLNTTQLNATEINERLISMFSDEPEIDYDAVIAVLLKHINHEERDTRMAVLKWISHIHCKATAKMFVYMDRIFPLILSLLSDTCDKVLLLDLQLLSDICEEKNTKGVALEKLDLPRNIPKQLSGISPYLIKFASSLLKMFHEDTALLNERGVLIIRQLCLLLGSVPIYRCLSALLSIDDDADFISQMVTLLNGILLTSAELFEMRTQLRLLDSEEYIGLFECLYRTWSYQPIALLGLCILSQNYEHASKLTHHLWRLNLTVDILVEIDRLVQLIESPILSYVRLDLLDRKHQQPLCSVLSALLMLLPQTDTFNTLLKRLQCIPSVATNESVPKIVENKIDFDVLLEHFLHIMQKHQEATKQKHRQKLAASSGSV